MGESVLVIRSGALGDTILTLPVLNSILIRHASGKVTFLGNSAYRDLLPPEVRFGRVDDPRMMNIFDSGHLTDPSRQTAYDHAYLILSRPEQVIKSLQRSGTRQIRHASSRVPPRKHFVEHLHEGLGLDIPPRYPALARLAPEEKKDLIWVHPGSGGRRKCIGLKTMMLAAMRVQDRTGGVITVTVGEADGFIKAHPHWEKLIRMSKIVVIENRPLLEICKRLGGARLFIGNDSGISHMATGLGIRSVVTFLVTDPNQWGPWVGLDQVRYLDLRPQAVEAISDYDETISNVITQRCLDLLENTS
jgi:heptosyltransferase-3